VARWDSDRYFHPDIEAAADFIRQKALIQTVAPFISKDIDYNEDD